MKNLIRCLAIITLLAGCKKDEEKDNTEPTVSTTLTGNWQKNGTNFIIKIMDDNSFSLGYGSLSSFTETSYGHIDRTNATFVIHEEGGVGSSCVGTPGNYNYSINGSTLTNTVTNDPCVDGNGTQRSIYVSGNWSKL